MIGEYFRRSTSNIYEQQTETLKNSKMCSDTTCVMHSTQRSCWYY